MRIIAGSLRGREVFRPKSQAVRPLGDKQRAALFDILGDISDATVLDAYAGSGAAGIEAMSRGAAHVDGIEQNAKVASSIRKTIEALNLDHEYKLHITSVEAWLTHSSLDQAFDIIIADPPYAAIDPEILDRLGTHLMPEGTMAISHSSRIEPFKLKSVSLISTRRYGDSSLSFYQA